MTFNGDDIESKASVTYIGMTLDQLLSGESVSASVLSKSADKQKFLYRRTRQFDIKNKKILP